MEEEVALKHSPVRIAKKKKSITISTISEIDRKGQLSIFKYLYHLFLKNPNDTICYINAKDLGEEQI